MWAGALVIVFSVNSLWERSVGSTRLMGWPLAQDDSAASAVLSYMW